MTTNNDTPKKAKHQTLSFGLKTASRNEFREIDPSSGPTVLPLRRTMTCAKNLWGQGRRRLSKQRLYERLPDDEYLQPSTPGLSLPRKVTVAAAFALFGILITYRSYVWPFLARLPQQTALHHETIPTFLSLRHESTGDLIYALDNPLYEQLPAVEFDHGQHPFISTNNSSSIQVTLSKTTLTEQVESITLSWSSPQQSQSSNRVQPQDVWVLYCGNDDGKLWSQTNIYEVATVAQIHVSNQYSCPADQKTSCPDFARFSSSSFSSLWHIPRFPSWHRQPCCQFVLYRQEHGRRKITWYPLAASSRLDTIRAVTTPTNLHLALTNDPTEMTVQFVSGQGTPIVAYGLASNPGKWIQEHAPGTSTTYTNGDLCMAPANETGPGKFQAPGLLHTVRLTDLIPSTKYIYKAGVLHGNGVAWSGMASFLTAPLPDDTDMYPFAYLVYADQGCPVNGWTQGAAFTAAVLANEIYNDSANATSIRMVHHFGDLSYAQGAAHQWDAWHSMIEPIAKTVPYHIGVGNHEYDYTAGGFHKDPTENTMGYHPVWGNFRDDSGGECGVPTSKRFAMPDSAGGVFYYAHDFASIHTIVLSSEHDLSPGSTQYEWLAADLAAVDRSVTPWLVVELHRPLYEGEAVWDQNDVGIALRMELEHLLQDFQVDLVLAGHYHAYHRTCDGLYQGKCDHPHRGPMHVTIGTAGAHLDEANLFDNPWSAVFIKGTYGYGRITVHNSTDMFFEFVQGAANDSDPQAGQVLDSVWIHRKR